MKDIYSNKLFRNTSVLVLLLLYYLPSYSQNKYEEGYIINDRSDTTKGYILNEDWERSPKELTFKNGLSDTPQVLTTREIKAFYISKVNRFYQARNVRYNIYKQGVEEGESFVLKEVTENVFLERLKSVNAINLYSLFDEKSNQRFYIEKQGEWTELVNFSYTLYRDGISYESRHPGYREQLKYLFPDCKSLNFNEVNYTEISLNKFFNEYFKCSTGIEIKQEGRSNKVALNFIVSGGLVFSQGLKEHIQMVSIGGKISLPRRFRNTFAIFEGGVIYGKVEGKTEYIPYSSIGAGSYIGPWKFQPYFNLGLLYLHEKLYDIPLSGAVLAGVGISYKKKIHLEYCITRMLMLKYSF